MTWTAGKMLSTTRYQAYSFKQTTYIILYILWTKTTLRTYNDSHFIRGWLAHNCALRSHLVSLNNTPVCSHADQTRPCSWVHCFSHSCAILFPVTSAGFAIDIGGISIWPRGLYKSSCDRIFSIHPQSFGLCQTAWIIQTCNL